MRFLIIFLSFLLIANSSWADKANRYLNNDKVVFEDPEEEDVLKVNMAFGFLTVLEFPEKPTMVAVGDNTLLQVEVPENSKNVVVKPLEEEGVTNLFVFTPTQRFNYQVTINGEDKSDYVVDVNDLAQNVKAGINEKEIVLTDLIKMTKNYPALKKLGNVNDKKLTHKRIYKICNHPKVNVSIIDLFKYKNPHYLIVYFTVQNANYKDMTITENNTKLYANGQEFTPQYIIFDKTTLKPNERVGGWLFLKNSYIALDNNFQIAIGAGDEKYRCQ